MRNSAEFGRCWDTFQQVRQHTSAWGLSLFLHLLVLVVLGLWATPAGRPSPAEVERVGQIVLARGDETRVDYFADSSPQARESAATATPQKMDAALPELPDPAMHGPTSIDLPGTTSATRVESEAAQPSIITRGRRRLAVPGQGDAQILAEDAARRRKAKGEGVPTRVALFGGAAAEGRSFVFLIDRSKSMGSEGLNALAAAEGELAQALASLETAHRFQIIAYHHQRVFLGDRAELLTATDENKSQVGRFLGGLAAFGGTDHEMGLVAALRLEPDVIFLLTDGGDPPLTDRQLQQMRQRAGSQTAIHCVQFGFGPQSESEPFMQRLAEENRGGYRYVDMLKP